MGNSTAPVRPDLQPAAIPAAPRPRIVHRYWLLASLAWFIGSAVALRGLAPFPPHGAFHFYLRAWFPIVVVGVVVGRIDKKSWRRVACVALVIAAFVLPSVAAAYVPGVKQPTEYPLPGGIWLAGVAAPDGSPDLYLIRGSAQDTISYAQTPWNEGSADLSEDRRHIVFSSDRYGSRDLFVMDLDPNGAAISTRRLTSNDTVDEESPSWSPDGSQIAYAANNGLRSTIAVIPAEGGTPTSLTTKGAEFTPDWSPDGRSVAYAAPSPGAPLNIDIWVMDADGSHRHPVIDASSHDVVPRWSPDGSSIAFGGRRNFHSKVFIVGADGEGLRQLSSDPDATEQPYAWSPDGSELVFLSDRSGTGGTFLYSMDAIDGSDVRLLVRL